MRFHLETFFSQYRKAFGPIQELQVQGLEFLLGKIESDPEWKSLPQVAYFLASIKHETGILRNKIEQSFQPIKELRGRPGTKIRAVQDKYWGSGYFGRGYIQITWKDNYAKFGIADEPEKALEPDTAYMIAARGMREGKFTKFKLSSFINDKEVDYFNARRIVNGLDKAEHIAEIAQKFERVLRASLVTDSVTEEVKPEEIKPEVSQITVQHADEVKATPTPIPGATKDDAPMQASQGGRKSLIATIVGVIGGAGTAIGGWLQNSAALKIAGVICVTVVLMALIFRQLIMDYVRLNYMSDPSRLNVK